MLAERHAGVRGPLALDHVLVDRVVERGAALLDGFSLLAAVDVGDSAVRCGPRRLSARWTS